MLIVGSGMNDTPIQGPRLHSPHLQPCAAARMRDPTCLGSTYYYRRLTNGGARKGAPFYPAFTVSSIGPSGLRSRFRRILLKLLTTTFLAPNAPLILLLDGTLERRWGERIVYKDCFHDAGHLSSGYVQTSEGLHWLCLMRLVRVSWCQRRMSPYQ